jgi:hypothetical protein
MAAILVGGMKWMVPSKIVSGDPEFQPRWPPSKKMEKKGIKFKKKSSPLKLLSEFSIGFYVKLS